MTTVTLASRKPALRVVALLNEPGVVRRPPTPGWEEIERPRRGAAIFWRGAGLPRIDLDLILDGYADGRTQEPFIRNLERMAAPASATTPPPAISLTGPFTAAAGFEWVIETLEFGDPVIRDPAGQRLRQGVTLTVARHVEADLIVPETPAKRVRERLTMSQRAGNLNERYGTPGFASRFSGAGGAGGKTYVVREGDTLTSIAARELRNASRWSAIFDLNDQITNPDNIRPGQRLRLPA